MKLLYDFFYYVLIGLVIIAFVLFLLGMIFVETVLSIGNWCIDKIKSKTTDRNGHIL